MRRRLLGWFWLFAGSAIGVWSVDELWGMYRSGLFALSDGAVIATLIGLSFCVLALICCWSLLAQRTVARILLPTVSVIVVLYGLAFLLFGGFEDQGPVYSATVALLTTAGLLGVAPLRLREP